MSSKPQSYRDLIVWQKSMKLAKQLYELPALLPSAEKFGLVSQIRRAAASVPSNIAEGQARHTTGEFILFISHAEGSAAELDTQLQLSLDLGFLTPDQTTVAFGLIDEVRRMLNALRRRLAGES